MSDIEDRLRHVEDQLAIYQVVGAYGYAVDGLNREEIGRIFADDGTYELSDRDEPIRGRAAVQAMTESPRHLALVGRGAGHVSTLPYVVIEGERAVATCHSMVVQHSEDGFVVGRLSASRVELERNAHGEWLITRKTNQLLTGDPTGPALLSQLRAPARQSGKEEKPKQDTPT